MGSCVNLPCILHTNLSQCILDVASWTSSNSLQLNAQKTEFIWCAPARRRHHIPNRDVQVGHGSIHPVQSARDLGVYVDGGMTNDDEDSHQSCTVVMLLRIETDQIYHAVSAITRAKHCHSRHCSGPQPVRLLQCCFRKSSSLWHPVYSQSSTQSGRRLIATRSRDFSAMRPPLAASQTARRVQAVYDGSPYRCSYGDAPSYLADLITPSTAATVRPGLGSASSVAVPRTISSLGDRSFAAAGPRAWNKLPCTTASSRPLQLSPDTFKCQLKTFLYNHAFNLHC